MINLLLPEDKKIILNEYRMRVIFSYAVAMCLLLVILIIAGASFYGASLISQNSLKVALKTEALVVLPKEVDEYSLYVIKANKMINLLTTDQNNLHSASTLFDRIIIAKPNGIKLRTIKIGRGSDSGWILSLQGISEQRNDLIDFIAALKKDPLFSTIDSPLANLIKGVNSEFSMTVVLVTK